MSDDAILAHYTSMVAWDYLKRLVDSGLELGDAWEDYPEISEADFRIVCLELRRTADMLAPFPEELKAAIDYFTKRCERQHEQ